MSNYATLKAAVANVVKTNGNQSITGANLQSTLLSIIDSLGADFQFAGIANPSTEVGTPDEKVFYIIGAGSYSNFGNAFTISPGQIGVARWTTSWSISAIDVSVDYDETFKGINKRYIEMFPYELNMEEPVSTIPSSFFYINGEIRENSAFTIYKFAVEPRSIYTFSGDHGASANIPFVAWADEDGNFIKLEDTEWASVRYTDEVLVVPDGAAYLWLNTSAYPTYENVKKLDAVNEVMSMRGYLPSCALGDVRTPGTWLLIDTNTYEDVPTETGVGSLRVSLLGDWVLQEFYSFGSALYKREFRSNATSVESWSLVGSGGGGGVTNEYTFNEYSQTVSLTATPTITTDTNNYLASTGDTTDRTADILAMLTATGTCHLGVGDFYVDSLVMPVNTTLVGCGNATRVKLKSGDNKFAIKMNSYCTVRNMWIFGSDSYINHTSTVGTRHGILWQGNYTEVSDSSVQPKAATIDNVYLYGFTGGGITCYDTGYGTTNYIAATNVHTEDCCAGLNISYWSEFHKFTNVRCWGGYYGCINNGGNNVFVNCDFSSNTGVAFLMDNAQLQSPNNSHGSCIGCVFNHTASNTGVGIKILNCNNGYVFDGCQIFFSQIQIEDTAGIVISSCNFGKNNCNISVTNGGVVLFANNIFQDDVTITVVNNTNVHFVNCYNRTYGTLVTN